MTLPGISNEYMTRRRKLALAGMVLAALLLRLGFCAATTGLGRYSSPDYREQITLATRIVTQGTFGNALTPDDPQPRPTAVFPPLYPLVAAGVFALLGIESYAAILALQILNAAATSSLVLPAFSIVRRISGSSRAAWAAAGITAVHPVLIGLTPRIWDTCLFALGVGGAVWLALAWAERSGRWGISLAYGAYLGALAHLNPALTPAYPVLVLWMLTRDRTAGGTPRVGRRDSYPRPGRGGQMRGARVLSGALLCMLGWVVTLIPWAWRTHEQLGAWCYVRDGFWQEVWLGVCPQADDGLAAALRAQFPLRSEEAAARFRELGEVAYFDDCERLAKTAICADPARYVRLSLRRLGDFWLGTVASHQGGGKEYWPEGWARRLATVFLSAETLASLVAAALVWRRARDLRWLTICLMVFSVVYALTHVEIRYRMPVEALIAVMVALGIAGGARPQEAADARARALDGRDCERLHGVAPPP
ncbi:MAG: hypothetical protein IT449_15030 [Phycisphaerales bacterium]|nr:hypothetical protein [Phycisphaerales bacterium]